MKQVFGVFFDRGERAYETRLQLADVTFAMFLYMAWGYVIRLKDDSQIGQRCVRFFFCAQFSLQVITTYRGPIA